MASRSEHPNANATSVTRNSDTLGVPSPPSWRVIGSPRPEVSVAATTGSVASLMAKLEATRHFNHSSVATHEERCAPSSSWLSSSSASTLALSTELNRSSCDAQNADMRSGAGVSRGSTTAPSSSLNTGSNIQTRIGQATDSLSRQHIGASEALKRQTRGSRAACVGQKRGGGWPYAHPL